jgi:sugar/nucleoside kinase (ribokinase family)
VTGRLIQMSGVIMDHVYWVDAVPAAGTEAVVHRASMAPGGGFNAMVAARRMGMAVDYGGTLGEGPFADMIAAALAREGIGCLRPRRPGLDQGCCTVLIDQAGERSFIAAEGADGVVTHADLTGIRPAPEDWLLLSGYALLYQGSQAALTGWLQARPASRLVFDPCPQIAAIPGAAREAALAASAWISANRAEAHVLTGEADPARAALALSDRAGGAVVRDGALGCWLASAGRVTQVPALAVRVVDTNGAGDTHIGAFIAALARGEDALQACAFANCAAALSITMEGPATAPTLEQVLAELAHFPHRKIQ